MISLLPEESATLTSPKGKTALRHPSPPQAAKEQGDYLGRPAPLLPILGAEGRSGQQADIDEAAAGCGEICPTTNTLLPMRPKEGALVPWAKLGLPSDL